MRISLMGKTIMKIVIVITMMAMDTTDVKIFMKLPIPMQAFSPVYHIPMEPLALLKANQGVELSKCTFENAKDVTGDMCYAAILLRSSKVR